MEKPRRAANLKSRPGEPAWRTGLKNQVDEETAGGPARRAMMEIQLGKKLPDKCVVMSLCGKSDCLRLGHLVFCNEYGAKVLGPNGHVRHGEFIAMRGLYDQGYEGHERALFYSVGVPLVKAALGEGAANEFAGLNI